jgi:hypothetical protein
VQVSVTQGMYGVMFERRQYNHLDPILRTSSVAIPVELLHFLKLV